LYLLSQAKLCNYVYASYANGIPLGAQVNQKFFKMIFLDIGLVTTALGLEKSSFLNENNLINKGGLAEQVVGQLLRTISPEYSEPKLYYWQRMPSGSSAEIDYVIQYQDYVVPLEVKAGSTGSLKSLHLFMAEKKLNVAVRINADIPSQVKVDINTQINKSALYQLISLPFYLIGQIPRILNDIE
jgi:predicted AAA+ superfamily ATPase